MAFHLSEPLGLVYLGLAILFGLILVALIAYTLRLSRTAPPGDRATPQEDVMREAATGSHPEMPPPERDEAPEEGTVEPAPEETVEEEVADVDTAMDEVPEIEPEEAPEPPQETSTEGRGPDATSPAAERPTGTRSLAEILGDEGTREPDYLARFVHDTEGERVGETVAFDEARVILKQGDDFLAISKDEVLEQEGELVADPNVDWGAARERGETWRAGQEDAMEYDDEGMPVLD